MCYRLQLNCMNPVLIRIYTFYQNLPDNFRSIYKHFEIFLFYCNLLSIKSWPKISQNAILLFQFTVQTGLAH